MWFWFPMSVLMMSHLVPGKTSITVRIPDSLLRFGLSSSVSCTPIRGNDRAEQGSWAVNWSADLLYSGDFFLLFGWNLEGILWTASWKRCWFAELPDLRYFQLVSGLSTDFYFSIYGFLLLRFLGYGNVAGSLNSVQWTQGWWVNMAEQLFLLEYHCFRFCC